MSQFYLYIRVIALSRRLKANNFKVNINQLCINPYEFYKNLSFLQGINILRTEGETFSPVTILLVFVLKSFHVQNHFDYFSIVTFLDLWNHYKLDMIQLLNYFVMQGARNISNFSLG